MINAGSWTLIFTPPEELFSETQHWVNIPMQVLDQQMENTF